MGLIITKLKSTSLIHTEHGVGPIVFNNYFINLISYIYDKLFGKFIIKHANVNIGISEASCNFLKDMGGKNVHLVHNGVNSNKFIKTIDLRKDFMVFQEYKIITFIGRLIYAKGVQDLIEAFISLNKSIPNIKLLIVGDGNYRIQLEKLAENHKNIHFLGIRTDIAEILSITDIFVNPSYSEGLPTSILEAASVGIPVVVTDVGGTKEIFIDEMGILIEKNNSEDIKKGIRNILENNKKQLSPEIVREYIKSNYDWDIITKRFLKIVKRDIKC
ncbi:hypothetical protein GCM10025860_24540 [Methanobacterium ferruginis]|nr:hypothetical protein GCM10025860_24540 [Methanobacterium ferruginis]